MRIWPGGLPWSPNHEARPSERPAPGGRAGSSWTCGSPAQRQRRGAATRENDRPGDPRWGIRRRGTDDAIEGYASRASVLPGEPLRLYVSTTSRSFTARAFRIGWYSGDLARRIWQSGPVRGGRQRAADSSPGANTVVADWDESLSVPTEGWPEGAYLLRLDADSGAQRFVPLTIRSATTRGRVVIKNAVETWQAYNRWGGHSLYQGPSGEYEDRSLAVSMDRPYDGTGADVFLVYERKLISLAERMGLDLAYLTGGDIAANPGILDGASALISPGHDEYWSPRERACVTAARDAGMNIAFLGANAMFRRTRLAPTERGPDRLIICYKTSFLQDPLCGVDDRQVTSDWREPPHACPESSVLGACYEGYPTVADYVVTAPDAWMFAGTGARRGTSFRTLVGIEYDRVNTGYPVPRPIQIVAHSPLVWDGVATHADSTYYTHPSGAGVFNAGTMRWVESFGKPVRRSITRACGLFTRQVTMNVLRAFSEGAAGLGHPARDNLEAVYEIGSRTAHFPDEPARRGPAAVASLERDDLDPVRAVRGGF